MKRNLITAILIALTVCRIFGQVEIPARLTDRPELIIKHTGYTVSYNTIHGTPNWSAWVLTKTHVLHSSVERSNTFLADPLIPLKYRVLPSDYQGSGFDRGHMAPAADMAYSPQSMHDCFYMSNMCPQVPALNRVSWKALETKCRSWVMTEDTLYIVCGPVYSKAHKPYTINCILSPVEGHKPSIDVATGFFKVVLSLRKGHAKAIGFYYANNSLKQPLSSTATTVDAIEKLTGIDFFSSLPDSIENAVESHFNLKDWK